MTKEFLKEMVDTPSLSGNEFELQKKIIKKMRPLVDDIITDHVGNVISVINPNSQVKVLLDAHIDEIGLTIASIKEDGKCLLQSVGSIRPSLYLGSQVQVITKHGILDGVISHYRLLQSDKVDVSELELDLGTFTKNETSKLIEIGDYVIKKDSLIELQNQKVASSSRKAVKVTIPVNLRKVFNTSTLRNFVLTVNIGVNPKKGEYSIQELCNELTHQLAYETTSHNMASRIAANVNPEINKYLRMFPIFVKNAIMNLVYRSAGEKKGSLNISNLGNTNSNGILKDEIERMEFIIGVQKSYPNNCGVISYNGKTYINMIRNIKESQLEYLFFTRLVKEGIGVKIESNWR